MHENLYLYVNLLNTCYVTTYLTVVNSINTTNVSYLVPFNTYSLTISYILNNLTKILMPFGQFLYQELNIDQYI
jgi:hypothetical protein